MAELSERLSKLPPYLFVEISRKIAEKKAKGERVISFAIGDPDLPTPPNITMQLCQSAHDPANHRYPETEGLPQLRQAIADWYQRRFAVELEPNKEVLPLIGSKEGIGHISFCLLNPGDIALVPDPGYPVYSVSTRLAGGETYSLPLIEENSFLPDLEKIPSEIADRAKVLWLNYPNNPTSAIADFDFFERVVNFARKHDLFICHDAAYTEVAFEGYRPPSFLQVSGSREVGVEFHSCSKSYNMTGWRIGMAVGNKRLINALMRFKSNLDSGIPQAIQQAAIKALSGSQEVIAEHNEIYHRRRDKLLAVLGKLGLKARKPLASLYIWARIPSDYTSSEFSSKLLDEAGVVVTPGTGYGKYGEGYIRLSFTLPDEELEEGLTRLRKWAAKI